MRVVTTVFDTNELALFSHLLLYYLIISARYMVSAMLYLWRGSLVNYK